MTREYNRSPVPAHIHRIAASEKYSDSLIDIQTLWGLDDIVDAHKTLDYFDEVARIRQEQAPDPSDHDSPSPKPHH